MEKRLMSGLERGEPVVRVRILLRRVYFFRPVRIDIRVHLRFD